MPNYDALIQADEMFKQLRGDLSAQGISDAAGRDAFFTRALSGFGRQFDPAAAQAAFGNEFVNRLGPMLNTLLETANPLAQQMTDAGLSTTARIDESFKDSVRQVKNMLAARGALKSGTTGFLLGRLQQERTRAEYDATQHLLDLLSQAQTSYTAAERGRQTELRAGAAEAADRVRQSHPAGEPEVGYLVPGTSDVYATASGRRVRRLPDGTFVDAADPAPPPLRIEQEEAEFVSPWRDGWVDTMPRQRKFPPGVLRAV